MFRAPPIAGRLRLDALGCRLYSNSSPPSSGFSPRQKRVAALGTIAIAFGAYLAWPSPSRGASTSKTRPLAFGHFTPVVLESSEPSGGSTKLLTLALPPKLLPSPDTIEPIHSIYIKDDDIQVERPYTPLYGVESDGRIRLWIKRYEYGEVGRWLHSKQPGDRIDIRGPVPTWNEAKHLNDGKWDEVVMISGGTGITPFFQLLRVHFEQKLNADSSTCFTLLHSSPTPSTLPPPQILSPLKELAQSQPDSFNLRLFVDRVDDENVPASGSFAVRRISKDDILETLYQRGAVERPLPLSSSGWAFWHRAPPPKSERLSLEKKKRVLFLVCGPDAMLKAIAGPRARDLRDGPVRGVLGELGFTSSEVRKF